MLRPLGRSERKIAGTTEKYKNHRSSKAVSHPATSMTYFPFFLIQTHSRTCTMDSFFINILHLAYKILFLSWKGLSYGEFFSSEQPKLCATFSSREHFRRVLHLPQTVEDRVRTVFGALYLRHYYDADTSKDLLNRILSDCFMRPVDFKSRGDFCGLFRDRCGGTYCVYYICSDETLKTVEAKHSRLQDLYGLAIPALLITHVERNGDAKDEWRLVISGLAKRINRFGFEDIWINIDWE